MVTPQSTDAMIRTTTSATHKTLLQSFRALAINEGLKDPKSRECKDRRKQFFTENVQAGFKSHFGTNARSLNEWKRLLNTIGIEGSSGLKSVKQCKEASPPALKGKFINIVDLVDAGNARKTITKPNPFTSEEALSGYIKRTEKIFPKDSAKANPLLKQFLIAIGGD
ncbi:hypothetical protein V5O48_003476 [Marasmius crinis-equi]|uniref:Uncharacterized protein n=1 Tax=Marasmius crinis-equi TaxID=585013 RepID=A0ABR3FSU5_9AGAR